MLKYFILGLLAVSCRGAPLSDDQSQDPDEAAYVSTLLQYSDYEGGLLPSEMCTDDKIVVNFKLYTRENPGGYEMKPMDRSSMRNSSLNVKRDTKIYIHQWLQNDTTWIAKDYVSAFLKNKREAVQVIIVDYSSVSRCQFLRVREMQSKIAEPISDMLKALMKYGIVPSKFHLIGLGMGAQIAGFAARQIHPRKVGRLTALDPTFIGYLPHQPQLRSNDSDYMDVIHTAQRKSYAVRHLGNARFYVNDGSRQALAAGLSPLVASVHSHLASAAYYLESIVDISTFKARKCKDYLTYLRRKCEEPAVWNYMGDEPNITLSGDFYLQVESVVPPFGNPKTDVRVYELVNKLFVSARSVVPITKTDVETAKKLYEKKIKEAKPCDEDTKN